MGREPAVPDAAVCEAVWESSAGLKPTSDALWDRRNDMQPREMVGARLKPRFGFSRGVDGATSDVGTALVHETVFLDPPCGKLAFLRWVPATDVFSS